LLNQSDIADFAIEDLRRWKCWDKADRVLAIRKTEAFKVPVVERSVLRYCLRCKGNKAAADYVAECRKKDAESVEQAEELLKLEEEVAKPEKTPAKKGKAGK
jgi:hypothetical protein